MGRDIFIENHTIFVGQTPHEIAAYGLEQIEKLFIQKQLITPKPFHVALSGGETPKKLYELMSSGQLVQNPQVSFFLADERYCSKESPQSNQRLLFETLFAHLPKEKPFSKFFPMDTDLSLEEAALGYEKIIQQKIQIDRGGFDVVSLGLGEDLHTASLFMDNPEIQNPSQKLCIPVKNSPKEPKERLTLTPKALIGTQVIVMAQGSKKAAAIEHAILGKDDACPIHTVLRKQKVTWLLDEPAAQLLFKNLNT